MICACHNIAMGSYANSVTLPDPPDAFGLTRLPIQVDACIAAEIQSLWALGTRTVASCCGHNQVEGIISVDRREDYRRMLELGYLLTERQELGCWSFRPKYRRMDRDQ